MNILAGDTADYRFDSTTKTYKPAAEVAEGPVFTVATLDFWQANSVLDNTVPPADKIRKGLQAGLISIDGDKDKAAKFIEKPKATLVNPLFDLILEIAAGN